VTRSFDAIIVGAGQAGPPLAERLDGAGMRVALVERHLFGGTCVNTGCMPTKTLVASAYAAHMVRRAADFGIEVSGEIGIDFPAVMARAHRVTLNARSGVEKWVRGLERGTVITGHARFAGPRTMTVGDEELIAERIFLNVGGRALIPDMPGVRDVPLLTNSSLLDLDRLPEHLVIIGGSYVGLEFAQMFRRFGAQVTVVEKGHRLVSREDSEVSDAIREIVEGEGITVRSDAECIRFSPHEKGVEVHLDCSAGDRVVVGNHVLLAVGRRPNTDDLGLEAAGIATDKRGYIVVNDRLETSVAGVWAMGDCNGRGAFTHTSYNDHEIIADNLLSGADRKLSDRIDCYALYIDPPLGRVGLSAGAARAKGIAIKTAQRPMTRVGRAVEKAETAGFMEIVCDAATDRILGGTILGTGGDEAIHAILDMMANGATATKLAHTMHIHPTVSELLPTIAGTVKP
jgi:pyruvate/2-oxoglutarate dehydrogenase complex dihydrolipoamide dehydrogenase (E3) component